MVTKRNYRKFAGVSFPDAMQQPAHVLTIRIVYSVTQNSFVLLFQYRLHASEYLPLLKLEYPLATIPPLAATTESDDTIVNVLTEGLNIIVPTITGPILGSREVHVLLLTTIKRMQAYQEENRTLNQNMDALVAAGTAADKQVWEEEKATMEERLVRQDAELVDKDAIIEALQREKQAAEESTEEK
jgi:hypothetical protein